MKKFTSKYFLIFLLASLIGTGGFISYTHADTIQDFIASLSTKELGLHVEDNAAIEGDLYIGENLGVGTANPTEKLTVDGVIETSGGIKFADGSFQGQASNTVVASENEAKYGENNYTMMTPLRTKQASISKRLYRPSDNLIKRADTLRTSSSTNYEKIKEVSFFIHGSVRIKFSLNAFQGSTVYG